MPPAAAFARPAFMAHSRTMQHTHPSRDQLETFPNTFPGRDYLIEHVCPEFTSVCPKTGQPDFGTLIFRYIPGEICVELKSLKMYLQAFRNEGIFYENVTNRILDDLVAVLQPRRLTLVAEFTPRGGIRSRIVVSHPSGDHLPAIP
jgi:7-cyano-7-deazaguanine reductase